MILPYHVLYIHGLIRKHDCVSVEHTDNKNQMRGNPWKKTRRKKPSRVRWMLMCLVFCVIALVIFQFQPSWNIYSDSGNSMVATPSSWSSLKSESTVDSTLKSMVERSRMKVNLPILVVGYAKSGSTSLYQFFNCSGLTTQHYCTDAESIHHPCSNGRTMSSCILNNLRQNQSKILQDCGNFHVYTQLDGERPIIKRGKQPPGVLLDSGSLDYRRSKLMRHLLPQHFYLTQLHEQFPMATWILPLRPSHQWAESVLGWFHFTRRLIHEYEAQEPDALTWIRDLHQRNTTEGKRKFLETIYDNHTQFVKEFARQHPPRNLLELDITDDTAGKVLTQRLFADGQNYEHCWGRYNVRRAPKPRRRNTANRLAHSKG